MSRLIDADAFIKDTTERYCASCDNSNGDFCHPWGSDEWKMFDGAYY